MTERKDRDLQTVLSVDGKSERVFDRSKATEHRTERTSGFDHSALVNVWITEFGHFVRVIEPVDSDDFHWQQLTEESAHILFTELELHHLVSDDEFKKILI